MSLVTKVGFAVSGASILVVNKLCVFETNLPSFVCAVATRRNGSICGFASRCVCD